MEDQTKTPNASRHQRRTRGTRTEAWRLPIRDEPPLDFRVDDLGGANNVSCDVLMPSRIAEKLWRFLLACIARMSPDPAVAHAHRARPAPLRADHRELICP